MKKIVKYLLITLSTLLLISACSPTEENNASRADAKVEVVTSIFPVYEMTDAIADDETNVSVMVGANEDAHHYEPSAQAVAAVNEADIFIYSSNEMEFWVDSLLDVVENEDLKVVELAEGLDLTIEGSHTEETHSQNHAHEGHDHGNLDPHFWLDPVAVNHQLPLIVETLAESNPASEEAYQANAEVFSNQLKELNQAYEEAFVEATDKHFVVQHQAFGHLANRYGLNQIAVGGLATEVEPAPRELARIVDFVNQQEVPVVYYQSGGNSAIAETIAQETGTDIAVLHDLERKPASVSNANNAYLEAMYQNLEQLKKSIQ